MLAATGVVVALLVVAMTVGRASARGRADVPVRRAAPVTGLGVLRADGIGRVRFGASPASVRRGIDALVGQPGSPYQRRGSCGLDHQITWWEQRAAAGEPGLITYFRRSAFAGYQFGASDLSVPPRQPPGGWTLATARGPRVGDSLLRGRHLYDRAFAISSAQGGSWSVHVWGGLLDGYAWGRPKHGDVSWQSVVSTIDAGDVGCAAVSP